MCDAETKRYFKVEYILQGLILSILVWGAKEMLIIRDHTLASNAIHAQIPSGFFTQPRWGLDDARKSQADDLRAHALLAHEMDLLDKKIALLGSQHRAHLDEANIWKDMIRELVKQSSSKRGLL